MMTEGVGVWVVATQPGRTNLTRMSAADFVRATRLVSPDELRYLTEDKTQLTVDTPVAGEQRGHTGCAGAVGVAVEEGEVGGHEVWPALHPHGQLGGEVGLSAGDERQQVISEIQTVGMKFMLDHLFCCFQTL